MQVKRPYPFYGTHYQRPLDEYEILEVLNAPESQEDEFSPDFYTHQSRYDEVFFFTDVEGVVLHGNSIYYKCYDTRIVSYVRDMLIRKKVIVFIAQNGKIPLYDFYGVYQLEPVESISGTFGAIDPYLPLKFNLIDKQYSY